MVWNITSNSLHYEIMLLKLFKSFIFRKYQRHVMTYPCPY